MSEIRSSDWNTFASDVAEAVSAGSEVQVRTGPETNGDFVAIVDGGPEDEFEDTSDDDDDDDPDEV